MIKIEIEYLIKGNMESSKIKIEPEDYFDPIEENETFENDAIARFNHHIDYLNISPDQLVWSKLSILGTNEDDRIIVTRYYGDGQTWTTHRVDSDGYEEIIHYTQESEDKCHIIRTHKDKDGNWIMNLNSVIVDMPDGSQKETLYN